MLLTADIGNTNIVLALLDHGDRVVSQRRIPSGEVLPLAAYEDAVRQVLAGHDAPEGAVIGSVVPRLTEETARAIRSITGLEALVVGPTTPAGLEIAIEEPETLGVDLLAADAAPNTVRRAAHFGEAGGALWLQMPFTKAELGEQLGRSSCAMLAVTDFGFAAALAEKLAARDEERYGPAAQQLRAKADRALMRQREKRQHEKNMRQGKHKPWAAPPSRPSKREEAPPTTSRRERGKGGSGRRPGRPETGTGRAPRTFPGKPGPGGRKLTAKPRSGGRNPAGKP